MQSTRDAAEIQEWIVARVAQMMKIHASDIDVTAPFEHSGMDSAAMMAISGDLEDWLGFSVHPRVPYDYPTIQSLAEYLSRVKEADD